MVPSSQGRSKGAVRIHGLRSALMTRELMMLELADDSSAWRDAGFAVADDRMMLDGVEFCFVGAGADSFDSTTRGIRGWHLDGVWKEGGQLDGLADAASTVAPRADSGSPVAAHPNGITGIDHLVVATPHLPRSIAAFEDAGLEARRTRTFRIADSERQQTFFWAGSTIIEMVGIVGEEGDGPASFWGLALVSDDLDATAAWLTGRISAPKDAIQPGRRIATLDTEALNISAPVAVMTPHSK